METADDKLYREEMARRILRSRDVDEEISIYDPGKEKTVKCGHLKDSTYHRVVKKAHYVYKYKGYAIQKEAFELIVRRGCTTILLIAPDKVNYTSPIAVWQEHAVLDDLGNGKQFFLPVEKMTKVERG